MAILKLAIGTAIGLVVGVVMCLCFLPGNQPQTAEIKYEFTNAQRNDGTSQYTIWYKDTDGTYTKKDFYYDDVKLTSHTSDGKWYYIIRNGKNILDVNADGLPWWFYGKESK